jgi:hypothetical protein
MSVNCELPHDRPAVAKIRLVVRSNRTDKPGRPMVRDLKVCSAHAKQLKAMGIEVVTG